MVDRIGCRLGRVRRPIRRLEVIVGLICSVRINILAQPTFSPSAHRRMIPSGVLELLSLLEPMDREDGTYGLKVPGYLSSLNSEYGHPIDRAYT